MKCIHKFRQSQGKNIEPVFAEIAKTRLVCQIWLVSCLKSASLQVDMSLRLHPLIFEADLNRSCTAFVVSEAMASKKAMTMENYPLRVDEILCFLSSRQPGISGVETLEKWRARKLCLSNLYTGCDAMKAIASNRRITCLDMSECEVRCVSQQS